MTCRTWRTEMTTWLGERSAPDFDGMPPRLREHAAVCVDCGARLAQLRSLYEGAPARVAPPPGLASRVTARLREASPADPRLRGGRFRGLYLAAGAAAVLALVLVVVLRIAAGGGDGRVTVEFRIEAPRAQSVSVVGDWNRWSPDAHHLRDPDGDGVWEIRIELEQGRLYEYQFIIDGAQWIPDPRAPVHIDDGFGGTNSVLDV